MTLTAVDNDTEVLYFDQKIIPALLTIIVSSVGCIKYRFVKILKGCTQIFKCHFRKNLSWWFSIVL